MATSSKLYEEFEQATLQPHYFNGRLLTATDLSYQQAATQERLRRVGIAVGAGIVEGFTVTPSGDRGVHVAAGYAVNAQGDVVRLPKRITFDILPESKATDPVRSSFRNCSSRDEPAAVDKGIYVLVASPATDFDGEVETLGISAGTGSCGCRGSKASSTQRGCGYRWEREGVAFELVKTKLATNTAEAKLRNRAAYECFGEYDAEPFLRLFSNGTEDVADIADAQVPIALVYLSDTVQWIDNWSVKRPCARPASTDGWTAIEGDPLVSRGKARFLQFQEQLAALLNKTGGRTSIPESFRYLPPAGLLPLSGITGSVRGKNVNIKGGRGFEAERLLSGVEALFDTATPEEARLAIERSWHADAVDLEDKPEFMVYVIVLTRSEESIDSAEVFKNAFTGAVRQHVLDELNQKVADGDADAQKALEMIDKLGDGSLSSTDAAALLQLLNKTTLLSEVTRKELLAAVEEVGYEAISGKSTNEIWGLFVHRTRDLFGYHGSTGQKKPQSSGTTQPAGGAEKKWAVEVEKEILARGHRNTNTAFYEMYKSALEGGGK